MPSAFLLRFQEECLLEDSFDSVSGTRTETKIFREQPDNGPGIDELQVLSRSVSATATVTAVPREGPDRAEDAESMHAVPRRSSAMATETLTCTYVKKEAVRNDDEREWDSLHAIPRSTEALAEGTKTFKEIKGTELDTDYMNTQIARAIPPCS